MRLRFYRFRVTAMLPFNDFEPSSASHFTFHASRSTLPRFNAPHAPHAPNATAPSNSGTTVKVTGSVGVTPKSRPDNRRASECPDQTQRNADQHQRHALAQNQHKHVLGPGAERHANSDLARALGHGMGKHSVETDGRQHHRQRAKRTEQDRAEARLGDRLADDRLHGLQFRHRLFVIQFAHR